jgi:hypothetical protein
MQQVNISRQELYDLVWSKPLISLSKKYKVLYPEFKKICEKMNIPLPGTGYWSKLKFNKPVVRPTLESAYVGEDVLTISIDEYGSTNNIIPAKPIKQLQKQIQNSVSKKALKINVSSRPDKLVIAARETLINWAKGRWNSGMLSTGRDEIKIAVTSGLIERALNFMDMFIKTLRERRHDILIRKGETYVIVHGTEIKIVLRERTVRVSNPDRKYGSDYKPTGILYLKMDNYFHYKEWDDKKLPLEEHLPNIIAKLEMVGYEGKIRKEENEKWWADEREKKRLEDEREACKEKELNDFKNLLKSAKRFDEVKQLRAYITAIEQNAISNNSMTAELNAWIDWAKKKTDWYDPLIQREDELLNNDYRANLEHKKRNSW